MAMAMAALLQVPAVAVATSHRPTRVSAPRCSAQMSTTLYDLPVSNHGARVRLVLYKAGLEAAVKVVSPMELGGLRSDEYLALNPQGKMPLLVDEGNSIWEADAICRHLVAKHVDLLVLHLARVMGFECESATIE